MSSGKSEEEEVVEQQAAKQQQTVAMVMMIVTIPVDLPVVHTFPVSSSITVDTKSALSHPSQDFPLRFNIARSSTLDISHKSSSLNNSPATPPGGGCPDQDEDEDPLGSNSPFPNSAIRSRAPHRKCFTVSITTSHTRRTRTHGCYNSPAPGFFCYPPKHNTLTMLLNNNHRYPPAGRYYYQGKYENNKQASKSKNKL